DARRPGELLVGCLPGTHGIPGWRAAGLPRAVDSPRCARTGRMARGQAASDQRRTRVPGTVSRLRAPYHGPDAARLRTGADRALGLLVLVLAATEKPARSERVDGLGKEPTGQQGRLVGYGRVHRGKFARRLARALAEVSAGNRRAVPGLLPVNAGDLQHSTPPQ